MFTGIQHFKRPPQWGGWVVVGQEWRQKGHRCCGFIPGKRRPWLDQGDSKDAERVDRIWAFEGRMDAVWCVKERG